MDQDVWYVAYGSNLSSGRLQRYLDRCDDSSGPRAARPCTVPHRLFFAHESSTWTGGTAFVDPSLDDTAATLTVAWLLGAAQFLQVFASENVAPAVDVTIGDLPTIAGEALSVVPKRYGLVIGVESPDGRPAFTFTTGEMPLPSPTRPAPDYVDTIVSGLIDHHGHSETTARAYLAAHGA